MVLALIVMVLVVFAGVVVGLVKRRGSLPVSLRRSLFAPPRKIDRADIARTGAALSQLIRLRTQCVIAGIDRGAISSAGRGRW